MRKLLLLLLPLYTFAQDPQLEKFVDSLVGPMNRPDVPGTMILVARDGKILLQKAYGLASLELNVPLKTTHAFAIGSVSKQFTAVGILTLAVDGKLKLSDDIRKYLPGLNTQGYTITIENLLTHTSGISSSERKGFTSFGSANGARVHPDEFLSYIMSEKLLFAPGTNWSYNNVAYHFAAIIIERVSGQPFGDYMKEHVFKPAGMSNTYIASDLAPLNNLPTSYSRGYLGKWRNENRRPLWEWGQGAGNMITTMEDMLNWDIALKENKVIPAEWKEKAWTPYTLKNGEKVNYGYGWNISQYDDLRIISHTGATYAYSTQSLHIPEKNIYIFYGTAYASDPSPLPKRLLGRMLNVPFPKSAPVADINLNDYVGSYSMEHPGARIDIQISDRPIYSTFTASGDTLYVRFTEREKTFLRPAGKDQFIPARSADPVYIFNRNKEGKVVSLQVRPFLFGSTAVSTPSKKVNVAPAAPVVVASVKPELLKTYAGVYYKTAGDDYFFVTVQDNKLFGYEMDITQKFELIPIGQNKFLRKGIEDISYSFKANSKGIMALTISGNRTSDYRKVAD